MKLKKLDERHKPMSREDLVKNWDNEQEECMGRAQEEEKPLGVFLNERSPANNPEAPGDHRDAVQAILEAKGIRVHDTKYTGSSSLGDLDYENEEGEGRILLNEYLDNRFISSALYSEYEDVFGRQTSAQQIRALTQQQLASAGKNNASTPGTVFDPIYDDAVIRAREFGPSVNYRELIRQVVRIREDSYRLPKFDNTEGERRMGIYPENTPPKVSVLGYDQATADFTRYRGAVGFTDDFIQSAQTRVAAVSNFVQEMGIEQQIILLERIAELATRTARGRTQIDLTSPPSTRPLGYTHTAGQLDPRDWDYIRSSFDNGYRPNRVIGADDAIRALRHMSRDEVLTVGRLRERDPGLIPPFVSLNEAAAQVGYAEVNENRATTGQTSTTNPEKFHPTELVVYDVNRSINMVIQIGREQDETQRDASRELTIRYFGVKVAEIIVDPNAFLMVQY